MKKIKVMFFLSILIFFLSYLSSCMRNSIEPKVYMYNPEVTFSTMEFDLKVVEPEEILVKEIYIKLYKENELEKTLTSNDGINKVGATENICFRKLDAKTRYKLEFAFDYFEQDYENEDVVIYSYSFTTQEDIGISGTLFNYSQDPTGIVHIDAMIEDENELATSYDFYVYKDEEIIQHYDMSSGFGLGLNRLEFGPLLPNGTYVIELCISFTLQNKQYDDFLLDNLEINITDYFKAPSAVFSDVTVEKSAVAFFAFVSDPNSLLENYKIQLVDLNNAVLQEIPGDNLIYRHGQFGGLYPDTVYKLRCIASYQTPVGTILDDVIGETKFKTDYFNIIPQATITLIEESNQKIVFDYSIYDPLSMITSLKCTVLSVDDEIIQTSILTKTMSNSRVTVSKPTDLSYYKIQLSADYSYLYYEVENEVIGILDATANRSEDFVFDGSSILNHIGESDICIIPKMIDGKEVTSISSYAFKDSHVTYVIIPESVTSIGSYAFSGCSSLTSITIGNSVTSIGDRAFYNCSSLTSITIGNSVTSIGDSAFYNCSSLTSIIIPESIASIGKRAFGYCTSLTSITIPNGVRDIGYDAFYSCISLTNVYYEGAIENWCSITFDRRYANPMDYASHFYLRNRDNEWEEVTSIVLPNRITALGDYAFHGWNNLTSITLPANVTSIGVSAFFGCSSLISIEIPDSVTSIGDAAFYNCSSLTSIEIPEGITSIGDAAFSWCTSITSVTIPNSVNSIEEHTFYNCPSLISITIPESVASIGSYAFYSCTSLTNVYYEGTIENWCNITFDGAESNPMKYASHFYFKNSDNEWEEVTSTEILNIIKSYGI